MGAKKLLKGSVVVSAGSLVEAGASFLRNIVIARLISVEDFGIASLFAVSMSLVEMLSNMAIDKIIVQADDGGEARVQATGHAFQALRGAVAGAVLFLAAWPLANLFGVPEAAWAFQWLALVPVARGFVHLDPVRYQRDMRFAPSVLVLTVPQLVALGLAFPLGAWLGNYAAMLWLILTQAVLQLALSHLLASRPYRWAWDVAVLKRMVGFGWPLLVNGLLMFLIFQGDKAIVGAMFTMAELGWFSAAFMLTLTPAMILTRVLQYLLLPFLSRARGDAERFDERYTLAVSVSLLLSTMLAVGMTLGGPALLLLLYGDSYAAGVAVMVWLALTQGVRAAKSGPMIVAIACAKTHNPMYANFARLLSLLGAIAAVFSGYGVAAVAIAGLLGEICALFVSMLLLRSTLGLRIFFAIPPLVFAALLSAGALAVLPYVAALESLYAQLAAATVLAILAGVLMLVTMPQLAGRYRRRIAVALR